LNKGNWNGNQILTDTAYFHAMTHPSQALNQSYGYLTWLNGQSSFLLPYTQFPFPGSICPNGPADMYAAIGKNGQLINVVPSQNLVFIRMGNATNNADVSMFLNDTIWQFINRLPCGPTAVAENHGNTDFEVFPNPATDRIVVTSASMDGSAISVQLVDLLGKTVEDYGHLQFEGRLTLDLPTGLPTGTYFVLIAAADGLHSHRLVKF
jgi:CubicO group peptidase (beta-lactamase class C family)